MKKILIVCTIVIVCIVSIGVGASPVIPVTDPWYEEARLIDN